MRGGKAKVKKSNVILDSDDDEDDKNDDDVKNGVKDDDKKDSEEASKTVIKCPKKQSPAESAAKPELTFSDLVRGQNGDLLFIQLPDHLPGIVPSVKDEKPQMGNSMPAKQHCCLENLPEGYLGKFLTPLTSS